MRDLRDIAAVRDQVVAGGTPAVLATVVKVTGSAYRGPGARLLVFADGTMAGGVSAGCLERDVIAHAERLRASGRAELITYDLTSDDAPWGLGMRCGGHLALLVEPLLGGFPDHLAFLCNAADRREAAVLATVFRSTGDAAPPIGARLMLGSDGTATGALASSPLTGAALAAARAAMAERRTGAAVVPVPGGEAELLVEFLAPPIALLLCGDEREAAPLAALARELGWRVRILGKRESPPTLDARSAAVVMTHDDARDGELLPPLLASPAPYVGLLGSRSRTVLLLDEMRKSGALSTAGTPAALHTPAGLDIGAETPHEVALSIIAEIQATYAGRSGGSLRDSSRKIHDGR